MNQPASRPAEAADTDEARRRIRAAYDPELLRSAGTQLVELLADHLARVERSQDRVLNWAEPSANVAEAARWLAGGGRGDAAGDAVSDLAGRFAELVQAMLSRGHNLHDPRYAGHQVPASIPLAGLFDAVGSVTNQVMAIYEMGPWASAVEEAMVETLGREIGWRPGEFAGVVTHGGSLANLTALLTARNVTLGSSWEEGVAAAGPADAPPVLVAHSEAHYCIARSAGILGLGTNQVVRAELDARRRIDPERLDETLTGLRDRGHLVVAVVACACATPVGAFDPLDDIADICRRHGVWMHVDAAHGGAACLSARYRRLVRGLERADSLIWDAHKMLFVPALCAFVFYRDAKHRFEAFRQDAPYLFDPSAPGLADYDSGLKTVECTKRAAAFGLWGAWSLFGRQLFADMVDVTFDLGRRFYEMLVEAPDFEPLHEPECNIVVFRHVPPALRDAPLERLGRFQLDLRRDLIESGAFYIVPTKVQGTGALRVTIINPLTTEEHLAGLMEELRGRGRKLM
ncbi:MAG TPA: pyridoxal-dependent decarboxylase [Planctomycetaceae bacterium]|nr:pyridoxal-dependent decarboxylase [Planctomycetaceae bacterium]